MSNCPMGFNCETMAEPEDCIFAGPPLCPNILFCRNQAAPRPFQPRYFSEMGEGYITDLYEPIEDEFGNDWTDWDNRISHFKAVHFGSNYNASEIEDLTAAGYAEPEEMRWT